MYKSELSDCDSMYKSVYQFLYMTPYVQKHLKFCHTWKINWWYFISKYFIWSIFISFLRVIKSIPICMEAFSLLNIKKLITLVLSRVNYKYYNTSGTVCSCIYNALDRRKPENYFKLSLFCFNFFSSFLSLVVSSRSCANIFVADKFHYTVVSARNRYTHESPLAANPTAHFHSLFLMPSFVSKFRKFVSLTHLSSAYSR